MPLSRATRLSSRMTPDMSKLSGIALVSRNSSATLIGGSCLGLGRGCAVLVDLLLRRLGSGA